MKWDAKRISVDYKLSTAVFTGKDLEEIQTSYESALHDGTFVNKEQAALDISYNTALGIVCAKSGVTAVWQITTKCHEVAKGLWKFALNKF